jgi:hypothetical protein
MAQSSLPTIGLGRLTSTETELFFTSDRWFGKLDDAVAKDNKAGSVEAIRKSFMMMTESNGCHEERHTDR